MFDHPLRIAIAGVLLLALLLTWLCWPGSEDEGVEPPGAQPESVDVDSDVALSAPDRTGMTEQDVLSDGEREAIPMPADSGTEAAEPKEEYPYELWFRCEPLDPPLVGELEVASVDTRKVSVGVAGLVSPAKGRAREAGATIVVAFELRNRHPFEVRTRDRHWSSGVLSGFSESDYRKTVPLQLRQVGRLELAVVDQGQVPVDITGAGYCRHKGGHQGFRTAMAHGGEFYASYKSVLELGAEPHLVSVERCLVDTVDLFFINPTIETLKTWLNVNRGETGRHTLVAERLPSAGVLAGTVRTQTGESPGSGDMKGEVRIVQVNNRRRQFQIPLEWEQGVAHWESPLLPYGEYRVWVDGTGSLFVTPRGERVLTPPLAGVDWTWCDGAERRNIGIEVFDAATGEPIAEVWSQTWFDEERTYIDRAWDPLLLRRQMPVDSPWRWEIYAEGYARQELRMADFVDLRTIPGGQITFCPDPIDIWIAQVRLWRE